MKRNLPVFFCLLVFSCSSTTVIYKNIKFHRMPSGILYKDVVKSSGDSPVRGQIAIVDIEECFTEDEERYNTGNYRFTYKSRKNNNHEILSNSIEGMKTGSRRIVIIPPGLQIGQKWIPEHKKNGKEIVLEITLLELDGSPKVLEEILRNIE